jgi:ATP-binding cassette subfamily B protein
LATAARFSGMSAAQARTQKPGLPQSALSFLSAYVRRRPWQFGLLFLFIAAGATSAVAVQYGMKLIVDAMSQGDRASPVIWRWLIVFISLIALESLLWRSAGLLGCKVVVATGVDVRLTLFQHLAAHSMSYFTRRPAGALGNRITATAGACGALLGTVTWKVLPPVIDFIGATVLLGSVDPRMAAALLMFAATAGGTITVFGLRGRPLHQEFARQGSRVGGELVDVVSNIWTVKAFSATDREHRRLQAAFGQEARAQRNSWMYLEKARITHDVLLWVMAGGMLTWAIYLWRIGTGTSGDVVLVSALTFRILHGSRDFALSVVDAAQQFGVIAETLSTFGGMPEVADSPDALPFEPRGGDIRFEDVSFSYARGRRVLKKFHLHVASGQRCGIVGISGAGKSTLLGLLQRLQDVDEGRVVVDGQDIREVRQNSLRASIAVVPQDVALFHRSALENVRYGRPEASDEEVFDAARNALCEDFILKLPEGWKTVVGDRGARLSGGQRQRLGIARAFLKMAPILLLDEATSALDSESERTIQLALQNLMKGKTVLAVAHRLSTLSNFDRVVLIDRGVIVEDGAPEVLREAGGLYARLWHLQHMEHGTALASTS